MVTGSSVHHVTSPFTRDQLSPAMRERYGLDRRPVGRSFAVGVLVVVFIGILVWVGFALTRSTVQSRLVAWDDLAADRVDITFEVLRDPTDEVTCVLRSQDRRHIDVGYATVVVPADPGGAEIVQPTYSLRTLAPAYTAELLGCEVTGELHVVGPQFPPGVVPPVQPWTAPA